MQTDAAGLPTSPLIIRAESVLARGDAAAIRAEATEAAARTRAAAAAERVEAIRSGREQGVREGVSQGARLAADAAEAVAEFWAAREAELQDLAFAVAHRLLASLEPDDRLVRLAHEAIAEHRRDTKLTLRVCTTDAALLRTALAAFDPDGRVVVEADDDAEPGRCTLLHPRGRSNFGLLEQFRALMRDGR